MSQSEKEIVRVIFKENGIESSGIYAASKINRKESPSTLDKLKILNDEVSWLDGLSVDLNGKNKVPLAVVIENHPASRPQQSGLDQAKIVYEALVEGGITRYLVVFDPINVEKIGPIRSARPYFVHWGEEFGGVFTHIGGSEEALAYLRNSSGVLNVDENEGEEIIWRDENYAKPHDAFTNTKNLYARAKDFQWNKAISKSFFNFKLKESPSAETVKKITVDFSFPSYKVDWSYDSKTNAYSRFLADLKQDNILVKNVIVQVLPSQLIEGDEKGRLSMPVVGSGRAIYFLDGKKVSGTWKKSDYGQKTIFYAEDGSVMKFNKGKTWVEVIDLAYKLSSQ